MMKTYLSMSGSGVTTEQVDELCQRLEQSNTREEVNAVNMPVSYTHLTLPTKVNV